MALFLCSCGSRVIGGEVFEPDRASGTSFERVDLDAVRAEPLIVLTAEGALDLVDEPAAPDWRSEAVLHGISIRWADGARTSPRLEFRCKEKHGSHDLEHRAREVFAFLHPTECVLLVRAGDALSSTGSARGEVLSVQYERTGSRGQVAFVVQHGLISGAFLLLVLVLRLRSVLARLEASRAPRRLMEVLGWTCLLLGALSVLDETGLLLQEVGVDRPSSFFSSLRRVLAEPVAAGVVTAGVFALVLIFVADLYRALGHSPPLASKLNVMLTLAGLMLLMAFAQGIYWSGLGTTALGVFSSTFVAPLLLYVIGLVVSSSRWSSGPPPPGSGIVARERRAGRDYMVKGTAIFMVLTETLITRTVVLWYVFARLGRLGCRLPWRRSGESRTAPPGRPDMGPSWAERSHLLLSCMSVMPLLLLWRVELAPTLPTRSFYATPMKASIAPSLFLTWQVFAPRLHLVSRRGLWVSVALFLLAFVVVPLALPDWYEVRSGLVHAPPARLLVGVSALISVGLLASWGGFTFSFANREQFLAGRRDEISCLRSWTRPDDCMRATFLLIIAGLTIAAGSWSWNGLFAKLPDLVSGLEPGSERAVLVHEEMAQVLINWFVICTVCSTILFGLLWVLWRDSGMMLRGFVDLLFTAHSHRAAFEPRAAAELEGRYPWLLGPEDQGDLEEAAMDLPEFDEARAFLRRRRNLWRRSLLLWFGGTITAAAALGVWALRVLGPIAQ